MYNFIYHEKEIHDNNNDLIKSKKNLFTPNEAFLKGTIFKNIYEPYKNYQSGVIEVKNEQEKLMTAVQMYDVALNDIDLYLVVYPNDLDALQIRREYYEKYSRAKDEYLSKYPSFTLDYNFSTIKPFSFSLDSFPWNRKESGK